MQIDMSKKALVVFSGGQDSTYCLFWALQEYDEVHAITFNYGQRHDREIIASKQVMAMARRDYGHKMKSHVILGIQGFGEVDFTGHEYTVLDNPRVLNGSSPLVSDNTLEQYADMHSLPGGLEKTFVPMRNQFFLTVAANQAFCLGINNLVTGVCQEDNGGYPDCTSKFIGKLQDAIDEGTFTFAAGFPKGIYIDTPLMYLDKANTVIASLKIPGCYEATAWSHTAYDGAYPPVGHDHATLLRAKGFEEAGIPDPLILRAIYEGLMPIPGGSNYTAELIEEYSTILGMEIA